MTIRDRRPLAAALSAALTLGLAAVAGAEDGTVVLVPGATIKAPGGRLSGAIAGESPTEVKVGNQAVPVEQIESLDYQGEPPSYATARVRERAGNLAEAADLYAKAATEAGASKALIARSAQFQRARLLASIALADPSKAAEAAGALEAFAKANPNARQLGPTLDLLARIQIGRGELDKAEKAAADLSKIGWASGRATVLQARVLGGRGKHDEAVAKLDAALGAAKSDAARRDAQLAKAEALAGLKRYDEAEALIRGVVKAAGPEDVETQAAAYNALGGLLREAGKDKDALLAYLHTDILYAKDRENHPKALARIVELCRALKFDDQAKDYAERLQQEYPGSPYAAAVR